MTTNAIDAAQGDPPLHRRSSVLAVIPHFQCERWLPDCLDSLVNQTRPLQGIAVIDDGSPRPPIDIVERFPGVTLLSAAENVGPYRLTQQVIADTSYDAYMFQDADDWSGEDRLEALLEEAERSHAEYVGCQGVRILAEACDAVTYTFPLDVNAALVVKPTSNPLHHPASLVARDLVMRIGGFATGLRYGGDTEFLRRAAHVARIVNSPRFAYFYRMRAGSLTSDPETGNLSQARLELTADQHRRALDNANRATRGEAPDLSPMTLAGSIRLSHLAGPALNVREPLAGSESGRAKVGHPPRR